MQDTPTDAPAQNSAAVKPRRSREGKSLLLCGLIVFNLLLVAVLLLRHMPDNRAQAAFGGVNAAELLAVPGQIPGFSNGVVYLLDGRSGLLTAISYDAPSGRLTWLPQPIDISQQLGNAGNARGGR
jgi:hypothetical protein